MAMQEQTEIAKQQLDYLRIMASKNGGSQIDPNLTNKGATPATPASSTRI